MGEAIRGANKMSVHTAIYKAIAASTEIKELLASSTLNAAAPAIYEAWAPPDTPMPYINLTLSTAEGSHWAKRDTALAVDIFSDQDSTQAEEIKNAVVKTLNRRKIELENGYKARLHYDSDEIIEEPTPEVVHWEITFSVYYFEDLNELI
jgi:hypothetical protein